MALHGKVIAAQDLQQHMIATEWLQQHMIAAQDLRSRGTSWLGLEHKSRGGEGHGRGGMTAGIDSRREGTTSIIGGRGGGRIGNREGSE
ncbi:hypothetical protein C4D60_Mb08t17170 [Musa balbisiana]|uniref:Uncharacterized protein n=1 Tax=Musa balbisiana TaxID=52838 RepID=A0A4S8K4F2_MUSBA|nr:hypothetical protein C4D60_Mb08t17170 [Musa balbisiana]